VVATTAKKSGPNTSERIFGLAFSKTEHWKTKMKNDRSSNRAAKMIVFRFLIELLIYGVLVSVYLALVIHFLTGWLKGLFSQQPAVYALVSIVLMILQAVGLEKLTSVLVNSNRRPQD
jgi:hypothetical protein